MDEPTQKTCIKCGDTKPLDDFYVRRGKPQARCKACVLAQNYAYAKANPQTGRDATKRWRERNPDKAKAGFKSWYEANREYSKQRVREWCRANPEAISAANRRFREADPARRVAAAEKARKWREENPERVAAWVAANQDRLKEHQGRRRARKLATALGKIDVEALWEVAGGRCGICAEPLDREVRYPDPMSRSLDHIIPLSRGGTHTQENLAWTHLMCNLAKGARLPDDR